MVINVLAIGDVANVMKSLSKITKKSKINIVNFPKDGKGIFIHDDNVDRFVSWKVKEQVEYINKIKKNYDICLLSTNKNTKEIIELADIIIFLNSVILILSFLKRDFIIFFD